MYRFPTAAREQKKKGLCTSRQTASNHREHSARCITSKTSKRKPLLLLTTSTATSSSAKHAENDENQPQEPSPPNDVENRKKFFQKPPQMIQNMYPQSNEALRDPQKNGNCGTPQFSARPNQGTCRSATGASTTIQRTVPVKVHGLLHSVHCAYQDLYAAGMSTTLLMN